MYIFPGKIDPTGVIAGCIAEFKNVWSEEKVDRYIEGIALLSNDEKSKVKFERAITTGYLTRDLRTNSTLSLSKNAEDDLFMREINNDFHVTINSALTWYREYFGIAQGLYINEGFNILKYESSERYGAHYDGGTSGGRSVSPILYLNDDYVGGELEFVNYNIKIKPTKGSLYLFPSNYAYRHIAHPVESGTKYAIVTWVHDRPLDEISQSQLYFDPRQTSEYNSHGHHSHN